tara:strand:- start:149 stop:349 length:201 start_codon:yes stop_codon:yes gene_type:complete
MESKAPPKIILHKSKEVIFYIGNDNTNPENIQLWIKKLNLLGYRGLVIHSKCIFNRLLNDPYLGQD